jgi:HSP20 family protein
MLMRFDPFREFDRLADQLWSGAQRAVAMDAYRLGDEFQVDLDLPGIDPASIDLTVENNVLTVSASRHWEGKDGVEVLAAERPHGTFTRQLFLGESLDTDRMDASYDNGVLTLRIPVADQAKPRKVAITSGSSAKEIEAPTAA